MKTKKETNVSAEAHKHPPPSYRWGAQNPYMGKTGGRHCRPTDPHKEVLFPTALGAGSRGEMKSLTLAGLPKF